jgi:hypothetical protein
MIHANIAMNDNNTHNVINHFFNPYFRAMYTKIANVQIKAAIKAHCNAFSHNDGLTLSSCINTKAAGIAQLFKLSTNSFAVVDVNCQSIWAVHPQIFAWITGLVIISHPTNIAI